MITLSKFILFMRGRFTCPCGQLKRFRHTKIMMKFLATDSTHANISLFLTKGPMPHGTGVKIVPLKWVVPAHDMLGFKPNRGQIKNFQYLGRRAMYLGIPYHPDKGYLSRHQSSVSRTELGMKRLHRHTQPSWPVD